MKKLLILISLVFVVACEKEEPPTNVDKSNSTEYIKVFVDMKQGVNTYTNLKVMDTKDTAE